MTVGLASTTAGAIEVVTKLSSVDGTGGSLFAQTLSESGIVRFVIALYQALRSASVSLVASSTFVMRFRL